MPTPLSKHTPGPWEVDAVAETVSGFDEHGERHIVIYELGTNAADIRLIAAAPDLVAALQSVDMVIQQWRESGKEPAYHQWLTLQDVARAALAKAQS